MIPWETTPTPRAIPESTITIGSCQLAVREHDATADKRWQFLLISFGEFSDAPMDECLKTWPKRSIQLARHALSELQRRLKELDE